ncbi:MAG: branched-chain-amino-acid transaminase [Phycisphaerales bacterium]
MSPVLKIWMNGELVDKPDATVSVYDHGLLYGDGAFEGIRAYNGRVFKLGSHLRRLANSLERIRLKPRYSSDELDQAIRATLNANDLSDAYIRLVVTRGAGTLGLHPFKCPVPNTFIITDHIQLYPDELYDRGMKVIVAKRPRNDPRALDPAIKSLNYLNNILAKIEAIDAGVLEAIMLNPAGEVAECTGDNIFAVNGESVTTPPASAGILEGVTRAFVMELCRDLEIPVSEKKMTLAELKGADEVFLTGTAAEIIAVTQIDDDEIGPGTPGPVTDRLLGEFRRRVSDQAPED